MLKTIICSNCKERVETNPRLKDGQKYCGKPECQRARKREWYRQKIETDSGYAERQKECKRKWRKKKPGHQYQKQYRERCPEYVRKNRQEQLERNHKRRRPEKQKESEKIVKIDALGISQAKTNTYRMRILTPNKSGKIVKIDTLLVQLQLEQGVSASFN